MEDYSINISVKKSNIPNDLAEIVNFHFSHYKSIIKIIIIIISIFKEDNVFSIIASLPYGPPMNTDIDYYRTFFGLFVSGAMIVVRCLLGEEKPVLAL